MSQEHAIVDSIFCRAVKIATPEERDAYLASACGDNLDVKRRVERLLDAHFGAVLPETAESAPLQERPGAIIDKYRLLQPIGEGGFGIVFMAEQQEPIVRRVALKVIKPGMDTKEVVARFDAERQALALMDHPNIARILDAGTTESGRPYFVMELVKGIPITDYCEQNNLTIPDRLDLFVSICLAVQHAHQKAVIHRDLKPTNVLVTLHDGKPVVKVIDFGIAKALDQRLTTRTLFTEVAQVVGTPLYMSPEQAKSSVVDVDTRSDVYSLGVLLYELLTGSTPFDKQRFSDAALDEIGRMIREEEPAKPSTKISGLGAAATTVAQHRRTDPTKLSTLLSGDLDWIVMKALEKDRTRRYETAKDLAADVLRHVEQKPVEAGPPSYTYRVRKYVRRHKAMVAGVSVVVVSTFVGLLGTTTGLMYALHEWGGAIEARDKEAESRKLAEEKAREAIAAREAQALEQKKTEQSYLNVVRQFPVMGARENRINGARVVTLDTEWSRRANVLEASLARMKRDSMAWMPLATMLILAGEENKYRQLCHDMATQFAGSGTLNDKERTIKICLLLPEAISIDELPLEAIENALDSGAYGVNNYSAYWGWAARSLAAYRMGEVEKALEYCGKAARHPRIQEVAQLRALVVALRALALAGLKRSDEARQSIVEVKSLLNRMLLPPVEYYMHDVLIARLLCDEAERRLQELDEM